jgi:hypothetical protein
MNAFLAFVAGLAGCWALVRIAWTARRVGRANRLRTQELRAAVSDAAQPGMGADYVESLQQADAAAQRALNEDYTLSGVLLAALGAVAMFAGRGIAYGQWAVGFYTAGTIAIVAGVALAITGAVLRLLVKPVFDSSDPTQPRV